MTIEFTDTYLALGTGCGGRLYSYRTDSPPSALQLGPLIDSLARGCPPSTQGHDPDALDVAFDAAPIHYQRTATTLTLTTTTAHMTFKNTGLARLARYWPQLAPPSGAAAANPAQWPAAVVNGIYFQHPPTWRLYPYVVAGSLSTVVGYLSTDPLHQPCTTIKVPDGIETDCAQPLTRLTADGVLIILGGADGPASRKPPLHPNSTVAGRPASITETAAQDDCQVVGAQRQIHVLVPGDRTGRFYPIQLTACFAGPVTAPAETTFRRLIPTIAYR
ncbi:hypothetical protein [Nakamurella endophytica]|uniref:hypothetical protein n=1 Tax=Nakamurella endophytica TaxID=1748367 RepID=UPI00166A599F|nr:hypothetical protein [Nakamurella endophytica]